MTFPQMTDHDVLLWTMIASAVSALGTVGAAIVAWQAASAWRDGLKQQRSDEFVIAINDCGAAIGRTITRKDKGFEEKPGGLGVDEAWESWRRLRTAFAVLRRYYPRLDGEFLDRGVVLLKRMEAYTESRKDEALGIQINRDYGAFQADALEALR